MQQNLNRRTDRKAYSCSNKYSKARQWCKAPAIKMRIFEQPLKKVGYAQTCC